MFTRLESRHFSSMKKNKYCMKKMIKKEKAVFSENKFKIVSLQVTYVL